MHSLYPRGCTACPLSPWTRPLGLDDSKGSWYLNWFLQNNFCRNKEAARIQQGWVLPPLATASINLQNEPISLVIPERQKSIKIFLTAVRCHELAVKDPKVSEQLKAL